MGLKTAVPFSSVTTVWLLTISVLLVLNVNMIFWKSQIANKWFKFKKYSLIITGCGFGVIIVILEPYRSINFPTILPRIQPLSQLQQNMLQLPSTAGRGYRQVAAKPIKTGICEPQAATFWVIVAVILGVNRKSRISRGTAFGVPHPPGLHREEQEENQTWIAHISIRRFYTWLDHIFICQGLFISMPWQHV